MEEITHVDQRTAFAVHETDRASVDLLAKVYQRLKEDSLVQSGLQSRVQTGQIVANNSVQLQEVSP